VTGIYNILNNNNINNSIDNVICIINGIFHNIFRALWSEKQRYHEGKIDAGMLSGILDLKVLWTNKKMAEDFSVFRQWKMPSTHT